MCFAVPQRLNIPNNRLCAVKIQNNYDNCTCTIRKINLNAAISPWPLIWGSAKSSIEIKSPSSPLQCSKNRLS